MAEGQQQDARALLMESLWSDPEIRPEMERLIKKKHPQAPIPGYDARVEADKALVAIRKEREEVRADIRAKVKNKEMSEDDKERNEEEMQKIVDDGIKGLEETARIKMKELEN